MAKQELFTFLISLSVLDHLGRKLYRSFSTILGEAISNSWDADAENVKIYINKDKTGFFIKDDGEGMNNFDFQNKFLKVGYSKRKDIGKSVSEKGRPFIGRKGIGKLALLSCAKRIHVISKRKGENYVGGIIDNTGLDDAINQDVLAQEYPLENIQLDIFGDLLKNFENGTIIYFENLHNEIKHRLEFLRKTIALYFRFSLYDNFNIFLDDIPITIEDLSDLAEKTEFLWKINDINDPYLKNLERLSNLKETKTVEMSNNVKGFFASVITPRYLNIATTDGRVSVDLFVNGRLRETHILKHIPTARVPEDYLYGQIHADYLDNEKDKFTSSREGVIADDPDYQKFLEELKEKVQRIINDWDKFRRKNRETGDEENPSLTPKERKSEELFNETSKEFEIPENPDDPENKKKVDGWFGELVDDARYNLPAYTECFISENLIRKHIKDKNIILSDLAIREVQDQKEREQERKREGNVNIDLRQENEDISYLDMDYLSRQVDFPGNINSICHDAKQYKPIRNALMHTALLTQEAKQKLITIRENIKARVKRLLSGN